MTRGHSSYFQCGGRMPVRKRSSMPSTSSTRSGSIELLALTSWPFARLHTRRALDGGGLVLVALVGIVVVPIALKLFGIGGQHRPSSNELLIAGLFVALLLALACLYRYGLAANALSGSGSLGGPSRPRMRRRVLWFLSRTSTNWGTTTRPMGLRRDDIRLVWMWLSTIVVLVGAAINAKMERRTAQPPIWQELGNRGARMADEVGEAQTSSSPARLNTRLASHASTSRRHPSGLAPTRRGDATPAKLWFSTDFSST